jgi:hypothetical protein
MTANNSNTNISKLFQLNPPQVFPVVAGEKEIMLSDPTVENDFTYARKNLYDVIEIGQSAALELSQIASQSQHPRAFEVLSGLLKTMVESNRELLDIQKKRRDLSAQVNPNGGDKITNNLVITTADLQKIILGKANDTPQS